MKWQKSHLKISHRLSRGILSQNKSCFFSFHKCNSGTNIDRISVKAQCLLNVEENYRQIDQFIAPPISQLWLFVRILTYLPLMRQSIEITAPADMVD